MKLLRAAHSFALEMFEGIHDGFGVLGDLMEDYTAAFAVLYVGLVLLLALHVAR